MEGTYKPGKSLMTEIPQNSPEVKIHKPVSREHREEGKQVFEVSSNSPQPTPHHSMDTSSKLTTTWNPSIEPGKRRRQRGTFGHPQLATERQMRVDKTQGSVGEPLQLEGMKPEARSAKQHLSPLKAKSPGPWIQEGDQAGSFEACLNYDRAPSSFRLATHQRKRKSTWKAEAQSPGEKVHLGQSQSCKDLNHLVTGSPFPEVKSRGQACFPGDGPEHSCLHTDEEAAPWACRTNLKTPVYSGNTRTRPLPQKTHQGYFAKHYWARENHYDPNQEGVELWNLQEKDSRAQTHTDKPTHTQIEKQTHPRPQESIELRLQALTARIKSSQAKKPQGRQTKMIVFQVQAQNPGQPAESGPRGEASRENVNSLPKASGPGLLERTPRPPLGCNDKTRSKKPAPLMAKLLKDYKQRVSRK